MTPAKTGGKTGNYEIDRIFKNVGRIHLSLGTSSIREFRNREALLDKLAKNDRYDVLRAFRDGKVSIYQIIEADDRGESGATLETLALNENLWSMVERVLPSMLPKKVDTVEYPKRRKTVRRYAVAWRALQRKGREWLGDDATIESLASVPWETLWGQWEASKTDWQHMKEAVSRTLTVALGDKYHPFARKVRQLIPAKSPHKRKPNVTLPMFKKIVAHAPEHAAPSYWTVVLTGMRVEEYLSCTRDHLHAETRTLDVPGGKTDGSSAPQEVDPRIWPIVAAGIPSRLRYKWLNIYWNRAVKAAGYKNVHMHDLRHSTGQWAIDQNVAESKVQAFYRHETPGMTRDYVTRLATLEVSSALADLLDKPKTRRRA